MTRRILLADADAFYVSVARLVDPEGAGRAELLIVGGASRRGVVTSASYEARKFGVTSAMPMARALRLCPNATVVPVPWDACVEKAREIRRTLADFAPVVETASSDEHYLDLSGTERLYKGEPLADTARRIREAVLATTRLSVSIGGGTSKLVAKMAATACKPAGVLIVPPGEEGAFLARFQLADIPMVGPRFQERLARFGLHSVEDAVRAGRERLVDWLGAREGAWLWDRVRGLDTSRVVRRGDNKSISRDETFMQDLDDDGALNTLLLELVDRAASDLREDGLRARTVTVKLRATDFTDHQTGRTVDPPISSDRAIHRVARELLARLRREHPGPSRLLGVSLSQLVRDDAPLQLSLLEAPAPATETEKDRRVAAAMDEVRRKLGFGAVALGREPHPRRRTTDRE